MIKKYKQNEINELVDILNKDGVISVPTDTVYGICAKINSEKAYKKIIEIKKRPSTKPLPIMCANKKQIEEIAIVNKKAEKLINAFMPGPITLILPKSNKLPKHVNKGKETIAIRMATSETLKEIIEKTGSPIFMTSANQSGQKTCTNIEEIEKACPTLDGIMEGKTEFKKASTIVDCTTKEIQILRQGPITENQIKKALENNK